MNQYVNNTELFLFLLSLIFSKFFYQLCAEKFKALIGKTILCEKILEMSKKKPLKGLKMLWFSSEISKLWKSINLDTFLWPRKSQKLREIGHVNVFGVGEAFGKAVEAHDKANRAFDNVDIFTWKRVIGNWNCHFWPLKYTDFSALAEEAIEAFDNDELVTIT